MTNNFTIVNKNCFDIFLYPDKCDKIKIVLFLAVHLSFCGCNRGLKRTKFLVDGSNQEYLIISLSQIISNFPLLDLSMN